MVNEEYDFQKRAVHETKSVKQALNSAEPIVNTTQDETQEKINRRGETTCDRNQLAVRCKDIAARHMC